ncbi:MAG: hypothetical protein WC533_01195 [Candidatus Pacearchaeota archaeon]
MKKGKASMHKLISFVAWVTGVIVALSVGFAMIDGVLSLPIWLGGSIVAIVAGWIVVVATIVGVILAIVDYAK